MTARRRLVLALSLHASAWLVFIGLGCPVRQFKPSPFFGIEIGFGEVVMLLGYMLVIGPPSGVAALVLLVQRRTSRARGDASRCRHCGYDMRATPDRCPECGAYPVGKLPVPPPSW